MATNVKDILSELPDPIQIQITNAGVTRTNLALFDYDLVTVNKPWPVGISVSTGIPNLTFQQLLLNLKNNPYKIGMVGYVPANYRQSGIVINHYDLQGQGKYYSMLFYNDPYQRQGIIYAPANFILDDLTNITLAVVPPGVTNLQLFPYDAKMSQANFPDVGKNVIITEKSTGALRKAVANPVEMPSMPGQSAKAGKVPEYLKYRYAVGGILVLATIGLIAWSNKDLKK